MHEFLSAILYLEIFESKKLSLLVNYYLLL